jgi:transposase
MEEAPMDYVTSIGLDVHARSVTAAAFDPITGEMTTKAFANEPEPIAEWIGGFQKPKAVYESGVTGFVMQRRLSDLGIDCVIGAVSKMHRPPADKVRKNDRNDALFLARMLAARNIVEVWVPDTECESCRNLARAYDDARLDLQRARQRLSKFLLRQGHVFNEKAPAGRLKHCWGKAHLAWLEAIKFEQKADEQTYQYYLERVHDLTGRKAELFSQIQRHAQRPRWKTRVDALMCLKGIDTLTAFSLVVEAGTFSRFKNAEAFSAWTGLVPSERSSGACERKGRITKAGNGQVRRILIESAWTYSFGKAGAKSLKKDQVVDPPVRKTATRGIRRLMNRRDDLMESGKKSVVANTAIARELAGWVWALGVMVENEKASLSRAFLPS